MGTDIEDNKCGWLIVQALTRVSAEQRQVLEVGVSRHLLAVCSVRGGAISLKLLLVFMLQLLGVTTVTVYLPAVCGETAIRFHVTITRFHHSHSLFTSNVW